VSIWPFIAPWITFGAERAWYVAAVAAKLAAYAGTAVKQRNRPWLALLYPFAACILLYVFVAAVARTLVRGGIEWRGTFYSLRALRANRV
jgi:hypothetical protein